MREDRMTESKHTPAPAPREKLYHYAAKINDKGQVSALCFKSPKAIDLSRALWTNRVKAVTCLKCKAALAKATGNKAKSNG